MKQRRGAWPLAAAMLIAVVFTGGVLLGEADSRALVGEPRAPFVAANPPRLAVGSLFGQPANAARPTLGDPRAEEVGARHDCLESMRVAVAAPADPSAPASAANVLAGQLADPAVRALYEQFEEEVRLPLGDYVTRDELSFLFEEELGRLEHGDGRSTSTSID